MLLSKRHFFDLLWILILSVFFSSCTQKSNLPEGDIDYGGLFLPDQFEAVVVADGIGRARHLDVNENGDIYVKLTYAKQDSGNVAIRDTNNDGKADRMYIHIIDENGNDVQEWCLDHGSTGDYAYYISSPGRNDTYVGGCLLYCGINNPTINTTGNVTITTLNGTEIIDPNNGSFSGTLNGTIIGHVNGTIKFFNHTNHVPIGHFGRDAGKDFHFYYNFID